jgi:ATP-dependent Clp protease ATP-binding subunit ClpB
MEAMIRTRVVGQDEGVKALCSAVRRNRAGLGDSQRPIGNFLFLGPTGVGKTELCKALAEFMFNDPNAMVRIDMSEFMEQHSVARLIGAPPGYVGYEEGGRLTEAVRRKPYSVILLDEVEKAHRDVFNVLLQVFDDGRLTDGQGRTVDFKNTVIIMTSNIASDRILQMTEEAESDIRIALHVKDTLKDYFKPEFLNRIDEIIVFHMLTKEHLADIVDIQLRYLTERLREQKLTIDITAAARELLIEEGYDPHFGARPLKRTIQQRVENPLADGLLDDDFGPGDTVVIDARDGELTLTKAT